MNCQVLENQEMIGFCEVSTAVLTTVTANFSNTWKMLENSGKDLFFGLGYMKYNVEEIKNWSEFAWCRQLFDSCIRWFLKHTKKLCIGNQKMFGFCEVSTAVLDSFFRLGSEVQSCKKSKND